MTELIFPMKQILTTLLALVAFAANSILCRLALAEDNIDPHSFTTIRLVSGAFFLLIICHFQSTKLSINIQSPLTRVSKTNILPALMLFIYAICFSYAYISLSAATGALILFFFVQLTLLSIGIINKQPLSIKQILGLLLAASGITYLLLPSANQPPLLASLIMACSGIAWGLYTFLGSKNQSPLLTTRNNFVLTMPIALISLLIITPQWHLSTTGITLALLSGMIASGLGYALWYAVLPYYSSIQSGVLQLTVPIITAFIGVLFINETITLELGIASLLTLGGLMMVMLNRRA